MTDFEIIGMLKSYVKNSLKGMGALKGAPCEIQSITETSGGHVVTFKWQDSEGETHTGTMPVENGTDGSVVDVTPLLQSGTKIAEIEVDGQTVDIYAPSGGGSGSNVVVTPILTSGEKIAEIDVDGTTTDLFAPNVDLPWVTPQDYGAKADGITDDSSAVAQALEASNEVYFPEGTYALSKQLVLNDNQKVFGAGSGKTILLFTSNDLADGQTYDRGRVVMGVSTYLESQTLAHDITLSGMTLTSNYDGQSTAGKTLLLLTNCKDVYVEDVSCIVTADDTNNANAMEVLENGHDITFVNCYFEQGQEVGIGCVEIRNTYSENCSNIKFFNCDFYKTGGVDEIFAVFTATYQGAHSLIDGVLCDGCRFESNPSANASSHAYDIEVTWGDTKNIVFTNCEFISKDASIATIKRLNHNSTNMEQVVFDHCTIKATRDSSASTRSPIFYIEGITSEDGIIQYLNGFVYGEGMTSLMSSHRVADVINCDIDCYIDGATCIDSTIYTGSRTRMGNGASRFIGCDIRHDSAITTAFLIQASIVKDCIYRSGRALTVQFTGANRNCIVEGNTFEPNVNISDYSTSNIAIDIVANNFKGDMFISSIVSSAIRRYALIDNLVGGNATVGGSSKVTVRRGNSFDGKEPFIPSAPSTDGTYSLQVTVADGVASYSWV